MNSDGQHVLKPVFPVFLALVFAANGLGAQGTAPEQVTEIAATVHKLTAIVPADKELPYDVPPPARPLLTQLKHQLRDLILSTLNGPAARPENGIQPAEAVIKKLKTVGLELGGEHQPDYFGGIASITVVQPNGHPELRAATTTLNIPCGDDTSLYILREVRSAWTLTLAIESSNYAQVDGAQGDFGYGISPPDKSGQWFLVTKDVNPWCTSNWADIRYEVLRIGLAPYQPMVLLKESDFGRRDEPARLAVGEHGFTLADVGNQSLDAGVLERVDVHRYSVIGDRVTRVPPIGVIPQDFVDEWIKLPWKEAKRWSSTSAMDRLESWHARLERGGKNWEKLYYYSELKFVQPCSESLDHWQIGLSIDSQERQDKLPPELFFTVVKSNNAFSMADITLKRPPGCPGEADPVNTLQWSPLDKELDSLFDAGPR